MCLLVLVYGVSRQAGVMASSQISVEKREQPVIVVDVGHGGNDLAQAGVQVVLTRDSDEGLYQATDKNKKMADMWARCALIDEVSPKAVVSIHQNSYHQEEINGGQVFYYKGSEKGKRLAELIQKRFDHVLGTANRRQAKANGNYYLLLHVKQPIVIVECGFLSNWKESAALNSEEYQDRLAWTIHIGIMQYLNGG